MNLSSRVDIVLNARFFQYEGQRPCVSARNFAAITSEGQAERRERSASAEYRSQLELIIRENNGRTIRLPTPLFPID